MSSKITRKIFAIISGIAIALIAVYLLFIRQPEEKYLAGSLHGYNHVKGTVVNKFKVNGNYGQGVAGTCCIMVPAKWTPNQTVLVEWEVDPNPYPTDSSSITDPAFKAYMRNHEANYRHYHKVVEIPEYDDPCSMKVHFLPCQEVKVSLSCFAPWRPEYPIQDPLEMKEPAVCPQK
ncbi:DUF3304 domain-containing protein [Proteus myxofaciens]|uniref:DUF3304 domain-containing protein n=1 Tax=Proteus myxofaciens ATCC 19692 TaxID=1354337 RepID=A0A198FFF2_9GAMM|nr:DUF3304 domain-containing protein [Proteus myxofaciens]OAT23500.1 hypothetical protein M983_2728 [Proteus myxofaciens ATCC 19692]